MDDLDDSMVVGTVTLFVHYRPVDWDVETAYPSSALCHPTALDYCRTTQ
jgi:hypothetical protein